VERRFAFVLALLSAVACKLGSVSSPDFSVDGAMASEPSALDAGAFDDALAAPADAPPEAREELTPKGDTWSYVYRTYFAGTSKSDTPGHCGEPGICHQTKSTVGGGKRWVCGLDPSTCYRGLVGVGVLDPAHPEKSSFIDPGASILFWFNPGTGTMPQDETIPNDQAAADIRAWVLAGATNDLADAGDAGDAEDAEDAAD
jgi:hypothetical protein